MKFFNGENLLQSHDAETPGVQGHLASDEKAEVSQRHNTLNSREQYFTFQEKGDSKTFHSIQSVQQNPQPIGGFRKGEKTEKLAVKNLPVYERMQVYVSKQAGKLNQLKRDKQKRDQEQLRSRPSILRKSQELAKNPTARGTKRSKNQTLSQGRQRLAPAPSSGCHRVSQKSSQKARNTLKSSS
jgi:hypothetical protein